MQRAPHDQARAQHQHVRVPHADTEPREIGHQSDAIGVVTEQRPVRLPHQCVHRAGDTRAVGEVVGEPYGRFFVRQGDVHAATATFEGRLTAELGRYDDERGFKQALGL